MMAGHKLGKCAWVPSFSFLCEMMRKTFFTDLFLITLWTNKYQLLSDHYFFFINCFAHFSHETVLT